MYLTKSSLTANLGLITSTYMYRQPRNMDYHVILLLLVLFVWLVGFGLLFFFFKYFGVHFNKKITFQHRN